MSAEIINIVGAKPNEQIIFSDLLRSGDYSSRSFRSSQDFFRQDQNNPDYCIILAGIDGADDAYGMIKEMRILGERGAMIFFSHKQPTVSMVVDVMRAGAYDFLDMPLDKDDLFTSLERAKHQCRHETVSKTHKVDVLARLARLTVRENEILGEMRNGHPNKNIAYHQAFCSARLKIIGLILCRN